MKMNTDLYPASSFSKRAHDSKIKKDLFANYAITCQSESLGLPSKFIDSLRSFDQIKQDYIELIRPYCCRQHYFSSYLSSYLSCKQQSFWQSSTGQPNSNVLEADITDIKKLAIESGYFDPYFYKLSNPDLNHCSNEELVDHFFEYSIDEPNRDPSQYFSVSQYYDLHPDVKHARLNALSHYLMYGN